MGTQVSKYRWIVLLAIVPIIVATEMMWLTLAPLASIAEDYYQVSSMSIALFSMSYMLMFIVFSLPASWVVDRFGFKHSLVVGAVLTGVFSVLRFVLVDHFILVLICQFFLAIGQPFLLNISTKVPANWFPTNERSTAAGILIMAQYLGFAIPMLVAPALAESGGIPFLFMVFAIVGVIAAVISIVFTREKPKVPVEGPAFEPEVFNKSTLINLWKNINYRKVLIICFISIGVFNTILTLIESILTPRGLTIPEAGVIGAAFVLAGIVGAVVLPMISDKLKNRVGFITLALLLLIPLYLCLTFIQQFVALIVVAILLGFLIMGVAPILFQHGSEVAYPIQEGTSLGVILLMGQISGVIFVALFELSLMYVTVTIPMLMIIVLTAIEIPVAKSMNESDVMTSNQNIKG